MSHDLFTDVVSPTVRVRSSSRYTLFVSVVVHALVVAGIVIVPLMATSALPHVSDTIEGFVAPPPSPPPPPMPQQAQPAQAATPINRDLAPRDPPPNIQDEVPTPPPSTGEPVPGGIDSIGSTSSDAFGPGVNLGVRVAQPDPPTPVQPTKPVRPGGQIKEPVKTKHVSPVYPQIALAARISGTVVIDAVIGTDGAVREARVLSGPPLLAPAALEAVRQWRYSATTLNGVPVPVIMTVTVRFNLN